MIGNIKQHTQTQGKLSNIFTDMMEKIHSSNQMYSETKKFLISILLQTDEYKFNNVL